MNPGDLILDLVTNTYIVVVDAPTFGKCRLFNLNKKEMLTLPTYFLINELSFGSTYRRLT